jgi:hypothetical protein
MAYTRGALLANTNCVQSVNFRFTRDTATNGGRADIDGTDNVARTSSFRASTSTVYPSHISMP